MGRQDAKEGVGRPGVRPADPGRAQGDHHVGWAERVENLGRHAVRGQDPAVEALIANPFANMGYHDWIALNGVDGVAMTAGERCRDAASAGADVEYLGAGRQAAASGESKDRVEGDGVGDPEVDVSDVVVIRSHIQTVVGDCGSAPEKALYITKYPCEVLGDREFSMTATSLPCAAIPGPEPTLAVAAGRFLILAGAVFGSANLVQFAVVGGFLPVHPAMVGASWAFAVGVFLTLLLRLRRSPHGTVRTAASWSRFTVLGQIAGALILLSLSLALKDWTIMRATSAVGMALYGCAWTLAAVRTGRAWIAAVALGCFGASLIIALLIGTPAQYLAYGLFLYAFALTPGLFLALERGR